MAVVPNPGTQQFNGSTGNRPQNNAEANSFLSTGMINAAYDPSQIANDGFVNLGPGYKSSTGQTSVPLQTAVQMWWKTPQADQRKFIDTARAAGYRISNGPDAFNTWKAINTQAAQYGQALGMAPQSVYDILNANIALNVQKAPGSGGASGFSSVVNLTNPDDAQVLVNNSLNQYLGRDATDDERDAFLETLNKVERKNPVVSTPTARSGGTNQQQVAKEFALSRDTAAEDTANSTYMNWMAEALMETPNEGVVSGL